MKHLDLFSGIGGFALAARWSGIETIGFSEIDIYASLVLKKHWPNIPNYGDIKNVKNIKCDIITGGFPCQPFSESGRRKGRADHRWIWPEMFRVIKESMPSWVIGENVVGIIRMEIDNILSDLENEGYKTRAFIIPACGKNAVHRRERVWIIANLDGERCDQWISDRETGQVHKDQERNVSKVHTERSQQQPELGSIDPDSGWSEYISLCRRMDDGIPNRLDRLKCLGNAIVPQISFEIMSGINEINRLRSRGHK